jgi:hypothetical protein
VATVSVVNSTTLVAGVSAVGTSDVTTPWNVPWSGPAVYWASMHSPNGDVHPSGAICSA